MSVRILRSNPQRGSRSRAFAFGPAAWLVVMAIFASGALTARVHAQAHGVGIAKTCESPRKVGEINVCRIRVTYGDGFLDTLAITDVMDIVDPGGQNVMIPFGELQIVEVEGNTTAVVGGTLPVLIGPEGSTAMGLPGEEDPGVVTFIQNTYVIDENDPNPLSDQATVTIVDLCDAQGTMGCSSIPSAVQFTAQTEIIRPAMMVQKSADPLEVCEEGTDVTYTYMVTNIGDTNLNPPTVTDDTAPCQNPTMIGGDTAPPDGLFSPGETWIYECTAPGVNQTTTNTVTVEAVVTDREDCILTEMDSATVTLRPPPPCMITGATSLCQFGLLPFTAPPGLASYSWSTEGGCGQIFGASDEQMVTIGFPNAGPCRVILTVIDEAGCSATCDLVVTVNPPPPCEITGPDLACEGDTLEFSGPPGLATYAWTTQAGCGTIIGPADQPTVMIQFPATGSCNVLLSVVDANGCTTDPCSILVNVVENPTADPLDAAICEGAGPGQICANPNGGLAPYTFSWTGPGGFTAMTACIDVSVAGTYMVTVTDANGCVGSGSADLTINPNPSATPDNPVICEGDQVPVMLCSNPSGGTAPYTFSWTGPGGFTAMTECINVSVAGTYTVTVTDVNGCFVMASGTFTINDSPTVNPDVVSLCEGSGSADICSNPSGGLAPYTFSWTGPGGFTAMTECINVSVAGLYMVTVTDANGCTGSGTGELLFDMNPVANPLDVAICESELPAEICANASMGQPPLTFSWTGPGGFTAMTECISVSDAGTYTVTVTDANQCTAMGSADLTVNPDPLAAPDDVVVCEGDPLPVELCSNPSGGTAPYTFSWTGPGGFTGDTECVQVSDAGTYVVTVTDANGCTVMASGSLAFNPPPTANPGDEAICEGNAAVEICANPAGGTAPYTFSWTGPGGFTAMTECINVSDAGTYTVTVTDANGCTGSGSADLTVNPNPVANPSDDAICEGEGPGAICANASGGTAPYTYEWTGPGGFTAMTECIDVTDAGTYMVTVTDANGCTGTGSADLNINPNPMANPMDVELCEEELPVELCANASGGTAPYTYLWSNGETTECIEVDAAGTFSVTVTDANGCSGDGTATVTVNPRPTAAPPSAVVCEEALPGEICAEASGGTGPYTYEWTGPNGFSSTDECISVTDPGSYCVTVTDANGCVSVEACAVFDVLESPVPTIVPPAMQPDCGSEGNTLTADISGGRPPYTTMWIVSGMGWEITSGQGTDTITYTAGDANVPGVFTLNVMDSNGCTASTVFTLECGDCVPPVCVATFEEVCVEGSGSSGSSASGAHSSSSGSGSGSVGSSGSSGSSGTPYSSGSSASSSWSHDDGFDTGSSASGSHSGSGSGSSSSGPGSGSAGSSGSSGSSGTDCSSGSSGSSSGGSLSGPNSSSSGPGSGSIGSSGSSGSSGTSQSSGSSSSSSSAHDGLTDSGSSASHGSGGSGSNSGASGSNSGSSGSSGAGGDLFTRINIDVMPSIMGGELCEPLQIDAVIDIGCALIPVQDGELIDLECLCQEGSGSSGSHSGSSSSGSGSGSIGSSGSSGSSGTPYSSGSSASSSGSDGADWSSASHGSGGSGASSSGSDSSQSGHSNSSGGSGGSAVRRCDCGEPSSGSSASASSLSSGGSVSSSSSGTGSSGGSGSSGWGSSSSGSDGPGDFIEDSSSSGPGSGSIGSSGSSGSSGTSYSSGSSASSSSSGGGVCCEWTPAGLHNHLTIRSDMAILIVTITDANGNVTECTVDLCEEPPPPPAEPCDDGKPRIVSLEYTGNDCSASDNSQGSAFECEDFGPLPNPAYIIANDDDDPDDGDVFFEGWVDIGQVFDIDAEAAGDSKLPSNSYFHVLTAPDGDIVQQVRFHTSCSKPLEFNDVFGSGVLVGFVPEGEDPPNPPAPAMEPDVNQDGQVDFIDVLSVIGMWGPCADCREDVDHSGMVDFGDVMMVIISWTD